MNIIYIILLLIIFLTFWIIFSKNTIISIISLVGIFLLSGLCFLLLDAEFLAFILILIYAGAISILFLFIIMMLNLRLVEVYNVNLYYLSFGIFIYCLFFFFFLNFYLNFAKIFNIFLWSFLNIYDTFDITNILIYQNNLFTLGITLFNYYYFFILISALILFLALIGTIYLTLGSRKFIKKKKYIFRNNRFFDIKSIYLQLPFRIKNEFE